VPSLFELAGISVLAVCHLPWLSVRVRAVGLPSGPTGGPVRSELLLCEVQSCKFLGSIGSCFSVTAFLAFVVFSRFGFILSRR
jgi:hypothetical protein